MSLSEWLQRTEAGILIYPAAWLLAFAIAINILRLIRSKLARGRKGLLLSATFIAILFVFTLLAYNSAMKMHYQQISLISKRVLNVNPNKSKILRYTAVLMSREFYFQVDFEEPQKVSKAWITRWQRCEKATDFGKDQPEECLNYAINSTAPISGNDKKCAIDSKLPFYAGKAKIAFDEEQYIEKNYSEATLIGNEEQTTYCFYWSH